MQQPKIQRDGDGNVRVSLGAEMTLAKYRPRPLACPQCQVRDTSGLWMRLLRLLDRATLCISLQYCGGGKDLEEEHTTIVPLAGEVTHVHRNDCAGIEEAHFHARCGICGYCWLMATRRGSA
jgi:hypothetical protein